MVRRLDCPISLSFDTLIASIPRNVDCGSS
jgi:hypothetical protein